MILPGTTKFPIRNLLSGYYLLGNALPSAPQSFPEMGFSRYVILYSSAFASLLAGASVTHAILKPDLTIPTPSAGSEERQPQQPQSQPQPPQQQPSQQ